MFLQVMLITESIYLIKHYSKNPMEFFIGIHGFKNANFLSGLRTINCLKINQLINRTTDRPSTHPSILILNGGHYRFDISELNKI